MWVCFFSVFSLFSLIWFNNVIWANPNDEWNVQAIFRFLLSRCVSTFRSEHFWHFSFGFFHPFDFSRKLKSFSFSELHINRRHLSKFILIFPFAWHFVRFAYEKGQTNCKFLKPKKAQIDCRLVRWFSNRSTFKAIFMENDFSRFVRFIPKVKWEQRANRKKDTILCLLAACLPSFHLIFSFIRRVAF